MHLRFVLQVFALLFFVGTPVCLATDASNLESPQIIAVQSRLYLVKDEVTAQIGYLPLDSFNRYVSYGGTYTHNFNGYESWEVLNINTVQGFTSGLTEDLRKKFGVATEPFNTLDYYFTSNLIYTPFFTKNLINDSSVAMGNVSFVAGIGMAKFDSGFINCADLGVIFRYYLNTALSLKFDFRQHIYFSTDAKSNLLLVVGLAFHLDKQGDNHPEVKSSDE